MEINQAKLNKSTFLHHWHFLMYCQQVVIDEAEDVEESEAETEKRHHADEEDEQTTEMMTDEEVVYFSNCPWFQKCKILQKGPRMFAYNKNHGKFLISSQEVPEAEDSDEHETESGHYAVKENEQPSERMTDDDDEVRMNVVIKTIICS